MSQERALSVTTLRKSLGWTLFALSYISFFLVFLVPFSNLPSAEKVALAGGLYIFCQVAWWLCVPLLGKEFIGYGKNIWRLSAQKIRLWFGRPGS